MLFQKKYVLSVLGGIFLFFFLWIIFTGGGSRVAYAACSADLQTTIVGLPSRVVVGKEFTFSIDIVNIGPAGYGPVVDILLPAGVDGDDGIDFISAAIQSLPIPSEIHEVTSGEIIMHPSLVDTFGDPIEVSLHTGEELVTLNLPFGSFVTNQSTRVTITAILDENADVNELLSLQTRGGFILGCDALNNYSTDIPVFSPTWDIQQVEPVVFVVDKYHPDFPPLSAGHDPVHAVIGPYHIQQYVVRIDIGSGQVLSGMSIVDELPSMMVYKGLESVSYPGYEIISEPLNDYFPHQSPDNVLEIYFPTVTGTDAANDIVLVFSYYIKDTSTTGVQTILSGVSSATTNTVDVEAERTPNDIRDSLDIVSASDTHTMINDVMIVKKDSLVFVSGGGYPGGIVEYPLEFDLSDYHQTSNLIIEDILQDGLRFDDTFQPYIEIHDYQGTYTGYLLSGVHYTLDESDIGNDTNPITSGRQIIRIDISQFIMDSGYGTSFMGGEVAPTTGTAAGGTIFLRARILDEYTDSYLPGNESVDVGDWLTNTATLSWDAETMSGVVYNTGTFTQSLSFRIQGSSLSKSIYAVNGLTGFSTPVYVGPGDEVTYRITYAMPSSDAEEIRLTDYLPLPIFSLSGFSGFSGAMIGTIPPSGWGTYLATDTLHTLSGLYLFPGTGNVTPAFSTNTIDNTLTLLYPAFNDPENRSSVIDVVFTVQVTPEPFADNFNITNMVTSDHKTTSSSSSTISEFVQIVLEQPDLSITKGIIDTTDSSAVFIPSPASPVVPGTTCPRLGSVINSTDIASSPLQSNLEGVEGIQRVTYALVIENAGGAQKGAYDVSFRDVMPHGFTVPASGLNLCIQNGAGDILSFEAIVGSGGVDVDLFGSGLKVIDPVVASGVGAVGAYTATGGDNIIIITYDLETTSALQASGSYVNTGVLLNFSSIEGGPNFVSEPVVDASSVDIVSPSFEKQLFTTSVVDTTGSTVVAGEEAVFNLTIAVPDSVTLSGLMMSDVLPSGLELVSIDSLAISGSIQLTSGYTTTGIVADAFIASGGGSFTVDLNSVINTDADLGTTEYIILTYTTRVANQYGGATNSVLTNDAEISWYTQDILLSLSDTESLIYRIPTLTIDKSGTTTNSSSERFASYTILVQNSSLVSAYDIDITDELNAKGLEFVSGSLSMLGVTGTIVEQGPDLHIQYPVLTPGAFSQIMFQTKIMTGIAYNTGITNVVTGTRSTISGALPEERSYTGSDSLLTSFTFAPSIAKTMLSTDQAVTTSTNVAVGETMVFRVAVTIPEESPFSGFTLTDQLDNGLKFVSVNLLQASGTITSTLGAINTGVIIPAVTSSDTLLTLNFGTLYNSDSNLSTNEHIILEYTVRVDDAVSNTNGTTKRNRARANRYTSPSTQSNVEIRRSVVVREPLLSLQKSAPATNTDSDRTITYTLQIANQAANVLTASNLSLTDILPADMNFISGIQVSGPIPDTLNFGTSSLIEYTTFPLGQTGVFQITARLDSSVIMNTSRTNWATGSWTSLPGVVSGERTTVGTDDASTNFTFALVPNKSLLSSDYTQTSGTQVTVGEQLMYEIAIEVPEDTTFTTVVVVDQLDNGLSRSGLDSLTASGTLTSSVGFGSVIPVISGQQITFNFGTLANNDLNTADTEYIRIRYHVDVDNIPENVTSTNLDNTVQTTWMGGSQVIGGPTVTVVEPSITIDKSGPLTNNGQVRTVQYVITVTNIGSLDVYDVYWDDIFSGTNLTLLDASWLSGTMPTSLTTGSDVQAMYTTLSGGASSEIQITARLNDAVITPVNIVNTVDAQWTNLLTGGRIYTGSDQLQTSFSTLPTVTHTVIATDQPHTVGTGIGVVGEIVTYQTRVRIPDDAVVHSGWLHELLATGYSLVDGSINIWVDTGVSCLPTVCSNVTTVTGTQYFSLDFGTITNIDADSGSDQYITVTYQVRIEDIPSVTSSSQLPTTATFHRSDNPTGVSQAVAVTVVEPSIDIEKSGPVTNTNSAREITYTISLENNGTIDAYTISGHDDLGAIGLDLLSVVHTSGPAPTITPMGNLFTYSLPTLAVGATTTLTVTARLQDNIPTAYIATNIAPISWSSLSAGGGRTSTGQDSVATSFITVGAITKEVIATSEATTSVGDIAFGEIVTYRVSFALPADATYNTVAFEDTLGTGLSYVPSSSVITVSGAVVCDPLCTSVSPVVNGSEMRYEYTSIANTATGVGMTGWVIIEYQAVLTDALALVNGSTTANSVTLKHSDVPSGISPISLPFTVVEPDIDLLVSGPVMNTSGARTVTYTIQVTNNGDAPAYTLNFSDILGGVGFDFISASHVAGVVPTSLGSTDPFLLTYTSLLPGESSEIILTLRLEDTIPTPTTITHTMTGTYTSDLGSTRTYVVADDASTLFTTPYTLSKIISNTSLATTQTPNIALGEYITYAFLLDMQPDSTLNAIIFRDVLSTGMSFIDGQVVEDAGISCIPSCGSAAFTVSGQEVIMEFATLANAALVAQQIEVQVTVRVDDIPSVNQGHTFINTVSLVTSDNTGGVVASAPTLSVVEPALRLTKDVTNVTGSRTALYEVTVDHLPSSQADAYDVLLEDPLFDLGFTYVSGSFTTLQGIIPSSSLLTSTGVIWTYDYLPTTGSSTIQFAARLDAATDTAYAKTNVLSGQWNSVTSGGRVYYTNDDATITLSSPSTLDHLFVTTDQAETMNTNVAIGEVVTYSVLLTVPDDGALTDAVLTLALESGFTFVDLIAVDFGPTITSSLGGTGSIGYVLSGNQVIIDLGVLSNDDINVLTTEGVTLTYQVRITDIEGNNAGQDLSVDATLDWSDAQIQVIAPEVEIIEAQLLVNKSAPVSNTDSARTITYSIEISHLSGSTHDAYDVVFQDDLAALGMQYVTGSLLVSGASPSVFSSDPLELRWDSLLQEETITFTFEARLHDSVETPLTIGNLGSVLRTSLSGDSLFERSNPEYLAIDEADTLFSSAGTQLKELLTTTLIDTTNPYVTLGEQIVYRLAIEVPEDAALNSLIIEDTLPDEVSYIGSEGITAPGTITSSQGSLGSLSPVYAPGPHTLTWNLGTLANSDQISGTVEYLYIAYRVAVDDEIGVGNGTLIENSASVTWSNGSLSGSSVVAEVIEPDLVFTKDAQSANFNDQHALNYYISIAHTSGSSSSAYEVTVIDDLAGGILQTSLVDVLVVTGTAPTTIALSGDSLVITYDSLALLSGSVLEVITTLDNAVTEDQLVTNSLTGTWQSLPDSLGGGRNPASDVPYILEVMETVSLDFIDLSLSSTVSRTLAILEDPITYIVTLTNTGITTAHDIQVLSMLPVSSGLQIVSSASSLGTYNETTGIRSISSLLPGESTTLTISVTSESPATYALVSEVISAREPDRDSFPNNHITNEDDIVSKSIRFANSGQGSSVSGGGGGGGGDVIVSPPTTSFDTLINLPAGDSDKNKDNPEDKVLSVFDLAREEQLPDERKECVGSLDMCPYEDGNFTSYFFSDVAESNSFAGGVKALVEHCVIHGNGDSAQGADRGTFSPYREVTWGEALKMIARSLKMPADEIGDHFTAKQLAAHRALPYAQSLHVRGILTKEPYFDDLISQRDFFITLVHGLQWWGIISPDKDIERILPLGKYGKPIKRSDIASILGVVLQKIDRVTNQENVPVQVCEQPIPHVACRYTDGSFGTYQFADLGDDVQLQKSISTLVQYCIIHGVADSAQDNTQGYFRPSAPLLYGEAYKMIARAFGFPEAGNHFSLKQDTLHRAHGYEQSLLRKGVLSTSVPNLDEPISYQNFIQLLGKEVGEDTLYEFTRGDAAEILATYLTTKE